MRPVKESIREYARGLVGGLMFSLPLLYTMEVWWAGFQLGSGRILLLLGFTMLLLLLFNTYAGVRSNETFAGIVIDSVEELGLGLAVSAAALFLLGRIVPGDSLRDTMGKVVVEALLIAMGISIGTAQISEGDEGEEGSVDTEDGESEDDGDGRKMGARPKDILGVVSLSALGAVVFATNIAITDEIVVIALESNSWGLLVMVAVSIGLSALVLLFSDMLKKPIEGGAVSTAPAWIRWILITIMAYAVAFCCSGAILYLFGRFDGLALRAALAETVVLAMAASLGSTAGRILIR